MSKLDVQQLLDHINFIQLWCDNLIIVHRPRQTLTDNTDITQRHIIEVTNKLCIHSSQQGTPFSCKIIHHFLKQTVQHHVHPADI